MQFTSALHVFSQSFVVDETTNLDVFTFTFLSNFSEEIKMCPEKKRSSKSKILREEGTLNPNPDTVKDPKFREGEFFDPWDIIQVKYEMLRRVRVDNASITDAVEEYGFCRPTYYQAKASFDDSGIRGLVPRKRGPRGPHKLQHEILEFLESKLNPGQPIHSRELATLLQQEFGLDIHPRTIERALNEKKTKRSQSPQKS